ncbi:MAG: hypothetical protein HZA22_05260 [Nitrospirae bacterium]|nr:hypothetical protein [Nitrospirota bacterium]
MRYLMCLLFVFTATLGYAGESHQFAIYLSTDKSNHSSILAGDINKIKLSDQPVITSDDIVHYSKLTHVMKLTPEGYDRFIIESGGDLFVVCVGKERIYIGEIRNSLSSVSSTGIVAYEASPIRNQPPENRSNAVQFRLGYPSKEYFKGKDMRSDPRIIRALKKAGKITWF